MTADRTPPRWPASSCRVGAAAHAHVGRLQPEPAGGLAGTANLRTDKMKRGSRPVVRSGASPGLAMAEPWPAFRLTRSGRSDASIVYVCHRTIAVAQNQRIAIPLGIDLSLRGRID